MRLVLLFFLTIAMSASTLAMARAPLPAATAADSHCPEAGKSGEKRAPAGKIECIGGCSAIPAAAIRNPARAMQPRAWPAAQPHRPLAASARSADPPPPRILVTA